MKAYHLYLLILVLLINYSCFTYKVFPKEYRKIENVNVKSKAYIINDSLKQESQIFKYSDLFQVVTDTIHSDLKIKLYPITKDWICGQPMVASMVTLGQLPVYFPDRYYFKFDEIYANDIIIERKIELKIVKRVWFWDILAFNKKFEKKAGKVLLGSYLESEH